MDITRRNILKLAGTAGLVLSIGRVDVAHLIKFYSAMVEKGTGNPKYKLIGVD